jgi:hypothetical protein
MATDLPAGKIAALRGSQYRRLVELQQRGRLPRRHYLIAGLAQCGTTDHEPLVGKVLAHGFADEPALALAGRRDRPLQMPRILAGKPHKQRAHIRLHIEDDIS